MRFAVKNTIVGSQAIINCQVITSEKELTVETCQYDHLSVAPTKKQGLHSGDRVIKNLETLWGFLSEWNNLTWDKVSALKHYEVPKPKVLSCVSKALVATFFTKPFNTNYSVWKGVGNTFFNNVDEGIMPEPYKGLQDILGCDILQTINNSPYVHGEYTLEETPEGHYNLYKVERWSVNV